MDVGDIAKASQLGRFGRILGHGGEYAAMPALAVLKPEGKVAKALAVNKVTKSIHGKAFDWTERGLDWAVHGRNRSRPFAVAGGLI